jgi:predicted RNA methylase
MTWAYDSLYIHRAMLLDKMLNEAYQRAIAEAVRPGDTVLDIGAGAGILSLLAARAGAGRVFAVEKTSIARVARRMVAHNGAADRVQVLEGDTRRCRCPRRSTSSCPNGSAPSASTRTCCIRCSSRAIDG